MKDKKCNHCKKVFSPKGVQFKFCSQKCYWESTKGKISKRRNGKNIKCKTCKKEFYISGSRIGKKKYCSKECGQKDDWGFKPKKKKCIICESEFVIESQLDMCRKTCSNDCSQINRNNISKKRQSEKVIKKCKTCGESFEKLKYIIGTNKCKKCLNQELSKKRIGKNNPNYKNGKATKQKFGGKRSVYTAKHFRECKKYRKNFLEKNGYLFCEMCNTSNSLKFETHHIVYASEKPKHKELHNQKNLILVCIKCHNKLHEKKSRRNKIYKERGLKKLFSE